MVAQRYADDQPRYTLQEARRLLQKEQCEATGRHRITRFGTEIVSTHRTPVWMCDDCFTRFTETPV